MSLDLGTLVGYLSLDGSKFTAELAKADAGVATVDAALDKVDGRTVRPTIDTTGVVPGGVQVDLVEAALDRLDGRTAKVGVDADTAVAGAALTAVEAEVSRLDGRTAKVDIDVDRDGKAKSDAQSLFTVSGQIAASAASAGAALATWGPALAAAGGAALVLLPAAAVIAPALLGAAGALGVLYVAGGNLQATFAPLVANFQALGVGLGPRLTAGLAPLVDGLVAVLPVLQVGLGGLADGLNAVLAQLLGFLTAPGVMQSMSTIMAGFGQVLATQIGPLLTGVLQILVQLGTVATPALGALLGIFTSMTARFSAFLASIPAAQLQSMISGAVGAIGALLTVVGQVLAAIGPMLAAVGPPVLGLLSQLGVILTALTPAFTVLGVVLGAVVQALTPLAPVIFAVVAGIGLWSAAQAVLNAVLTANPIGLVVVALAALVVGIVAAYQHSETFRDIVNAAWAAVKDAIGAVANWITGTVVPAITGAWTAISSATSTAWAAVSGAVTAAVAVVVGTATAIAGFVTGVVSTFAGLPGRITSALANIAADVRGIGSNAVTGIIAGITSMWGSLTAAAGQVTGKVTGALANIAADVKSIGSNIISGIISGITGGIGALKDAVTHAASSALDAAKGFLGIHSPSRVFRDQVGAQVAAGMAVGITSNAGLVTDAVASLTQVPTVGLPGGGAYGTAGAAGMGGGLSDADRALLSRPIVVQIAGKTVATVTNDYNRDLARQGLTPAGAVGSVL